jgi:Leucine-rich repeat (LRR) protein
MCTNDLAVSLSQVVTRCMLPRRARVRTSLPGDVLQNVSEYLDTLDALLSCRAVSQQWHSAVADALGFINDRCWTAINVSASTSPHCSEKSSTALIHHFTKTTATKVICCAVACLAPRLENLVLAFSAKTMSAIERFHNEMLSVRTLRLYSVELAFETVQGVERLPNLERLEIAWNRKLESVTSLSACRHLKELVLLFTAVNSDGLAGLNKIPTLELIDLTGSSKLEDVNALRGCPMLKTLKLSECTRLTDLGGLLSCPRLLSVDLARASVRDGVSDSTTQQLAAVPSLQRINFGFCKTIGDLRPLCSLRDLRFLCLSDTNSDQSVLAGLQALTGLQELSLAYCKRIVDVSTLGALRSLRVLNLHATGVTHEGIRGLTGLPLLEVLDLGSCKSLTDVSALQACRALKELILVGSGVTRDSVSLSHIPVVRYTAVQGQPTA